jgi:hypothetical protein
MRTMTKQLKRKMLHRKCHCLKKRVKGRAQNINKQIPIGIVVGFEEPVRNYGTECLVSGDSECHKMVNCVQNSSDWMGYCDIRQLCVHPEGFSCVSRVAV